MQRILDPATGSRARANIAMVEKVEAVDPLTVRFSLNIPYAGFQDIFGERQLRILAKDEIANISVKPIGTGPFRFKSWSPGDRLELEKNPDYFEQGLPKLDGVTMRIIPEAAARVAAIESGAIDILWNLPYETVDKFKNHASVRADGTSTATWDGVILNNERPPFNDMRVRQALAATIDKEAHRRAGAVRPGRADAQPDPAEPPLFQQGAGLQAKPDIAKAKKLLAEAGLPDGFEVTMQVPQEREQRVRLGVAVRDMAKAAGIRINVERVPFASYAANVAGKAQMYVDGYFARPTIDTALYPFYHSTGSWNRQLWLYKNTRVDELLDLARKTNDEGKRKAHLRRVPEGGRRDGAEHHPLRGLARQRCAQGGRGLPHHADAVAGAERGEPQALRCAGFGRHDGIRDQKAGPGRRRAGRGVDAGVRHHRRPAGQRGASDPRAFCALPSR